MPLSSSDQEGGTAFFDSAVSCKPDEEDFHISWQRTSATKSLSEAAANVSLLNWWPKKTQHPHNYIQLLPEWSRLACVIRESSSLGTRLPQDKLGLERRGRSGNRIDAFWSSVPPKCFSTYHFVFCINSLDAAERWTWNKWSLRMSWAHSGWVFIFMPCSFGDDCNGLTLTFFPLGLTKCEGILVRNVPFDQDDCDLSPFHETASETRREVVC